MPKFFRAGPFFSCVFSGRLTTSAAVMFASLGGGSGGRSKPIGVSSRGRPLRALLCRASTFGIRSTSLQPSSACLRSDVGFVSNAENAEKAARELELRHRELAEQEETH